jgi:hypothetical protein
MPNWAREFISRGAMLAIAVVLAYGGYRCVQLDRDLLRRYAQAHANDHHVDTGSGSNPLLWFLGRGLIAGAGFVALAAVVPSSVLEQLTRPARGTVYDENADRDSRWDRRYRGRYPDRDVDE